MRECLLVLVPLGAAMGAAVWPENRTRPWWLPLAGVLHTGLALWLLYVPPEVRPGAWWGFDPLARAMLPVVSILFLACSWYAVPYLRLRQERPNRVFVAALLAVLALLSAGHQARHLGLLWITTEAVTLATVPLVHFNGTARAFEATWKYLLVSGTGIALSLLGSFCLGYASLHGTGRGDLTFDGLVAEATQLSRPWMWVAWVLVLTGYGTKMGLAPMHTWKPDVYGEAPSVVGALLAGAVTTVAFAAILRVRSVLQAAGAGTVADRSLLVLGLFSLGVAALMLLGTRDFKRMLAYSSVEHMGILSVGTAMGQAGLWAALFHVWANCLSKGALFLSGGNLRRAGGGRTIDEVAGLSMLAPVSGAIFVTGVLAVTAFPPFAPFFSELRVLRAMLEQGHGMTAGMMLAALFLAFLGLTRVTLAVWDGRPRLRSRPAAVRRAETPGVVWPCLALLGLCLWLGLATPDIVQEAWEAAVGQLNH